MGKNMKKVLLTVLSVVGISAGMSMVSMASTDMDKLDVLISANYFLNSDNSDESYWPNTVLNPEIVPLYNLDKTIVAYYLKLQNGGYAVINNNRENPTMIEFGKDDNPLIRNILNSADSPQIIYNNPESLYDLKSQEISTQEMSQEHDLYEYYPDLKENNAELAGLLSNQKELIEKQLGGIMPHGDGDYGFVNWSDMPSGGYSASTLSCSSVNWVVTSDFDDIATNHCGATAVTNLAEYFYSKGYSNLQKSSNRDTFIAVHKIVGNGPVKTIADKAKTYFSNCGYSLNYKSVGDYAAMKTAIKNGRPCGVLLADGIVQWHWILSVGYREYSAGDHYMRIMDGWNRTIDRFYKINTGSLWVSATEYWM